MGRRFWFVVAVTAAAVLAGSPQKAQAQEDRFAAGMHLAVHRAPELGDTLVGYGFRFTYRAYLPFLSLDTELNRFPTSDTGNFGETQFLAGLKAGVRVGRWGGFFKVRPGVTHFDGGFAPQRLTDRTHFVLDLGGGAEYFLLGPLGVRVDLSSLRTYYGDAMLLAGPGGPIGERLGTRNNFQTTIGVVLAW